MKKTLNDSGHSPNKKWRHERSPHAGPWLDVLLRDVMLLRDIGVSDIPCIGVQHWAIAGRRRGI